MILLFAISSIIACDEITDNSITQPLSNQSGDISSEALGGIAVPNADNYAEFEENPFVSVSDQPISTFSIDADGASYANTRRFLMSDNQLPPKGAVRTEELINYFNLDYQEDNSAHPISLNGEISSCPWNTDHKLIRIGIKGNKIPDSELKASNYVFLIDVSGSMSSEDKLELLMNGFKQLTDELTEDDRVSIVTYAGRSETILSSATGDQKDIIKTAINQLESGGGTAGAEGILTAYDIAVANFIEGGNNRIIIGTDGDFNIGISDHEELITLIEEQRDKGIFLTVLGVGRGNLNDASLEQIANNGNGTYEYVDNEEQLEKVFIHDFHKFYTVAKDVKIQVDFNEQNISEYRLIGYENRVLQNEDFEDDEKDAGEIGSNQNITALYEIKEAQTFRKSVASLSIDFRYKNPDEDTSIPLSLAVYDENTSFKEASAHQQFVAAVASFSMHLTDSSYKGNTDYDDILNWLNDSNVEDKHSLKEEFKELVQKAKDLQ